MVTQSWSWYWSWMGLRRILNQQTMTDFTGTACNAKSLQTREYLNHRIGATTSAIEQLEGATIWIPKAVVASVKKSPCYYFVNCTAQPVDGGVGALLKARRLDSRFTRIRFYNDAVFRSLFSCSFVFQLTTSVRYFVAWIGFTQSEQSMIDAWGFSNSFRPPQYVKTRTTWRMKKPCARCKIWDWDRKQRLRL